MRGPKGCYAINGHPRTYTATDTDGTHIGSMYILNRDVVASVAGVHVSFPRVLAATVLLAWRAEEYTIRLENCHYAEDYSVCGSDDCTYCNGTDLRLHPNPLLD